MQKKKILNTSGLVKKTDYNSNISEIDGKVPNITGLATNSALAAVENKIPDVSNLVEKTDYNTQISETENKTSDHDNDEYITISEFNNLTTYNFKARLPQANLVTKTDFDAKLTSLNKKNNSNKTNHVVVENEFKKLQTFDSSYSKGKNHFKENGTQNYLVFQKIHKYFKKIGNIKIISSWKSKRLSNEVMKPFTTSNSSLSPTLEYAGKRMYVKFNGSFLKQDKTKFNHGKIVKIYIVYDIYSNLNNFDPTLEKFFFDRVKITKNSDIDKYKYSGYGIVFDSKGLFYFLVVVVVRTQ